MTELNKVIEQFMFSGQEPFKIAQHITAYIEENYTPNNKELPISSISWIKEWLDLFPSGVRTGGKLVKSDIKSCEKKMYKFLQNNPAYRDKELIFNVTKQYISEFEDNDYMYMKAATYFIDKKEEGSELAARCEEYLNTDAEEIPEQDESRNSFFI